MERNINGIRVIMTEGAKVIPQKAYNLIKNWNF